MIKRIVKKCKDCGHIQRCDVTRLTPVCSVCLKYNLVRTKGVAI